MNFRLTAIFFGLVVVLVGALLIVALFEDDKGTAPPDSLIGAFALTVKEKEVDRVEVLRTDPAEETLVFVKDGDRWRLDQPVRARVESHEVDGVIRDLYRAKPTRYAGLTDNLAVYGLDKPTLRVTLRKGADASVTVNLGETTVGGFEAVTFVTTSVHPKRPLAVKRSDLSALFRPASQSKAGPAWESAKWLADYRVRRLFGDVSDAGSQFEGVKVSAGGKELALTRSAGGAWTFASPAGFGEADDLGDPEAKGTNAPFTGVRPLLNYLTGLQATSSDDYIEKPTDLGQYGLAPTDPNRVRVELKPKNGPPEVVSIGKAVEKDGKPVTPAAVYCQIEGDPAVIKVTTDRVEALRQTVANPGELRNKDLVPASRRERIDAVDLTVGPATTKLRKVAVGGEPTPRWAVYGGPEPAPARGGEVEQLLTQLTRPRAAKEVLAAPNDAAFAGPEVKAVVKVWVEGVEKADTVAAGQYPPDPKLKGTPTELTFGKQEGDLVYVRRKADETTTDLKVPDAVLRLVTKGRLEYLDPGVKSFVTTAATRLTFNRGAEPYDLEKKDASGTAGWTFAAPPGRKGQPADTDRTNRLVGLLSGLSPDRVVSEQPTPDDLKRFGLESPRMKVTVALNDPADKERAYEFGNDADDKRLVYARQAGRPYVVLVLRDVYDHFATDDLRDTTLFRLDVAKVKRVKLRGWKGLIGNDPLTYQFDKQGAGWVAVSPPTPAGFTADPAKVASLVNALAAPHADAFIDVKAKPEYGLDPGTNPEALEISVEQEGAQPAGVVLVLGNRVPDQPGKVYGMSSAVPGEVFTITPGTIRTLTEKPAGLQR